MPSLIQLLIDIGIKDTFYFKNLTKAYNLIKNHGLVSHLKQSLIIFLLKLMLKTQY